MRNRIVATCPAGLGNRIKCLVSTLKRCGYYMNKGVYSEPHVYWKEIDDNKYFYGKFKEFFEYPTLFKEVNNNELEMMEVDAYHGEVEFNKSWKFETLGGKELDFKYNELNKSDIDEFLPYFKFIKPSKDIQDVVWAFMNKYKDSFERKEVIGVHIRNSKSYKITFDGRGKISTEDKFIKKMKDLLLSNSNYKFLLCTEDKETETKFEDIFGKDRIIYFNKKFRGNELNPNFTKEAFVDMLLLSKCHIIIASFLSTFPEVAWWLGGCKAQVIIPGEEDKEAIAKVWAQLPQKGEWIHKKIWRRIKLLWIEKK